MAASVLTTDIPQQNYRFMSADARFSLKLLFITNLFRSDCYKGVFLSISEIFYICIIHENTAALSFNWFIQPPDLASAAICTFIASSKNKTTSPEIYTHLLRRLNGKAGYLVRSETTILKRHLSLIPPKLFTLHKEQRTWFSRKIDFAWGKRKLLIYIRNSFATYAKLLNKNLFSALHQKMRYIMQRAS